MQFDLAGKSRSDEKGEFEGATGFTRLGTGSAPSPSLIITLKWPNISLHTNVILGHLCPCQWHCRGSSLPSKRTT